MTHQPEKTDLAFTLVAACGALIGAICGGLYSVASPDEAAFIPFGAFGTLTGAIVPTLVCSVWFTRPTA